MNLIILGAPGAGKGTLSDALVKEIKIPKISTGDMLRKEVKDNTPLGLKAKEIMAKGALVSDEIINELLKNRVKMSDCKNGFMLDGFPRTINQAKELDKIMKEVNMEIDLVVNLVISEEIIVKRLTNRRVCKKCGANFNLVSLPPKREGVCDLDAGELYQRADDNEVTIRNRLQVYARDTEPLIDYYAQKSLLKDVAAEKGISDMVEKFNKIIADKKSK
ncbi:MAG: adenylate kinase [Candidatus Firestonebacteria bacterium RIFOXYC2_FULL_39_67]|nr:MAG: adenylate kinase [Candidatus Firestonebacteria bacterium RIFOXYD2_FULL_39_29]OGF57493.1 MAG: adenylate kinase [Candidatus Firestonebacteria bacterium RIFOXYC2_FULL_39_67]OGF57516.1 MAG: adenylate kinase [Candidatus Firestonebacteria bacterium RifOxyC12_full_39_7]